jgi:hypothetical protein
MTGRVKNRQRQQRIARPARIASADAFLSQICILAR